MIALLELLEELRERDSSSLAWMFVFQHVLDGQNEFKKLCPSELNSYSLFCFYFLKATVERFLKELYKK